MRTRRTWALLLTCVPAVAMMMAPGASADSDNDDRLLRKIDRMSPRAAGCAWTSPPPATPERSCTRSGTGSATD
jgi:hypothetical protein